MKMQHIRVGVASLIVATVIGAGASAQSAHAAPAVKTYSNVQNFTITESLIKDIASKYGIDLSKISFNEAGSTNSDAGAYDKANYTNSDTGSNCNA
jgi:ABC-type metal ion transport system substrate-binding protein